MCELRASPFQELPLVLDGKHLLTVYPWHLYVFVFVYVPEAVGMCNGEGRPVGRFHDHV